MEIEIAAADLGALEQAERSETEALQQLGALHLAHARIEATYKASRQRLVAAERVALAAGAEKQRLYAAALGDLPPGEWTFARDGAKIFLRKA